MIKKNESKTQPYHDKIIFVNKTTKITKKRQTFNQYYPNYSQARSKSMTGISSENSQASSDRVAMVDVLRRLVEHLEGVFDIFIERNELTA